MIKKICKVCGKEFMTYPCRIGKYCSCKCNGKSLFQKRKGVFSKEGIKKHIIRLAGKRSMGWKGGRTIRYGYVMIYTPDYPLKTQGGYVCEHRLIMEKYLGRYLTEKEIVHHINGNRKDNRIENLKLFSNRSAHLRHHYKLGWH